MSNWEETERIHAQGRFLSGEFLRWYIRNVIKHSLTKEELLAYKVLKTEPKKEQYDVPFDLVPELLFFVWRNHFLRGLDVSGYDITVKSAGMRRYLHNHI
jgi:hypothetical protein